METPVKRILTGALFFTTTLLIAITGYRIGGCGWLDSIYMVVITVFGVGYGEICPTNTPTLKIFTIFVIIGGTSSAVYTVGGFLQMITEGELQDVLGQQRMVRGIESLRYHAIICGFGRIGQILARRLSEAKIPFVVIDYDTDRTAIAESLGYLVKTGNAADEEILRAVGIERAHVLATVLPDDATNVFITLTARELNPGLRILARGEIPSTEKKLHLAGADQVILPASISAARIAHMIMQPATLDFLEEGDGRNTLNELLAKVDVQVEEVAIAPNSPLLGNSIGSLEAIGKGTFIIVALRKANGQMIIHPRRNLILELDDILIVMGHRDDLPKLVQRYVVKRRLADRGDP